MSGDAAIGTEATRLMLGYAFDVLGLHNVQLTVHASNPGALRAYERAGFTAHRRATRRVSSSAGGATTRIYMDAIADDFPRRSTAQSAARAVRSAPDQA